MGLAQRELECRRHLDDLLSSSADASASTAGPHPIDIQDVYKYCRYAHRVCGTLHHPWYYRRRHRSPEETTHLGFAYIGPCFALSPFMNTPKVKMAELYDTSPFFQSLSPQMIILRVAMGRGWLKETMNEINTMLAFADPSMVQGQFSATIGRHPKSEEQLGRGRIVPHGEP